MLTGIDFENEKNPMVSWFVWENIFLRDIMCIMSKTLKKGKIYD